RRARARLGGVGESITQAVSLVRDEHLSLVLETPKRARVNDPIAVALECRSVAVLGLRVHAPSRRLARDRPRREALALLPLVGEPIAQRSLRVLWGVRHFEKMARRPIAGRRGESVDAANPAPPPAARAGAPPRAPPRAAPPSGSARPAAP